MQTVETLNEGLKRGYTVTIPAGDIAARVEGEIRRVAPQVRMPGFRPGKVPPNLIRKMHGPALEQDALNSAVQESVQALIGEQQLRIPLDGRDHALDECLDIDLRAIRAVRGEGLLAEAGAALDGPLAAVAHAAREIARERAAGHQHEAPRLGALGHAAQEGAERPSQRLLPRDQAAAEDGDGHRECEGDARDHEDGAKGLGAEPCRRDPQRGQRRAMPSPSLPTHHH